MKYQIQGEPMPVAICELSAGETIMCESGAMAWMTDNMKMETSAGGVGKMLGRMFSGETAFQNRYKRVAAGHAAHVGLIVGLGQRLQAADQVAEPVGGKGFVGAFIGRGDRRVRAGVLFAAPRKTKRRDEQS